MDLDKAVERRALLRGTLSAAGAIVSVAAFSKAAEAAVCRVTPSQTEGPFYPVDDQLDKDTDLTRVEGKDGRAEGQYIYLTGVVRGNDCEPVAGVLVEIWQACKYGRYDHPGDTSGLTLDPNFQYWGQTVTDGEGRYLFKTVIPGHYPAGDGWIRPPHIHFKAGKVGFRELTSQVYFEGHPLNDKDLILRQVPANQRAAVIVKQEAPLPGQDPTAKLCRFDITINRVV